MIKTVKVTNKSGKPQFRLISPEVYQTQPQPKSNLQSS